MVFLLLLLLIGMRFEALDLKAVHHDESINGWFTLQIWNQGWYQYDPSNYHGPLFFYLTALAERLNGWGIDSFRLVTVLFSAAWLIYLHRFWRKAKWSSKWYLLVVALSPGYLFFARSAIHETVFLFFMTLLMGGTVQVFAWNQSRGWRAIIWGLAGAILLKETWLLWVVAMVAAIPLVAIFKKDSFWRHVLVQPRLLMQVIRVHWQTTFPAEGYLHLGLALMAIALLYTGFGVHPRGLWDLVVAYLPWFRTGVQSGGHDKPFYYWLELLWRYEKPLLFLWSGLLMTTVIFARRLSTFSLWFLLATLLHFLIYSLIPYKTPWCMVTVFAPFVFGYGLWKTELGGWSWRNPAQGGLGLAALVALYFQWGDMRDLNYVHPTNLDHEYVYVQTDQRMKTLFDRLKKAAAENPALLGQPIQLAGGETWPMSWWFSQFREHRIQPVSKGFLPEAFLIILDEVSETVARENLPEENYEILKFPIREGRAPSLFFLKRRSEFGNLTSAKVDSPPSPPSGDVSGSVVPTVPVVEGGR